METQSIELFVLAFFSITINRWRFIQGVAFYCWVAHHGMDVPVCYLPVGEHLLDFFFQILLYKWSCYKHLYTGFCVNIIFISLGYMPMGYLASSIHAAWDSWSQSSEFKPHIGCRHYLKEKNAQECENWVTWQLRSFMRNCQTVLHNDYTHHRCMSDPKISVSLPVFGVITIIYISHSQRCLMMPLWLCISLMVKDTEHLFMCICVSVYPL